MGINAFLQCMDKILIGPIADTGAAVRCDVRRIKGVGIILEDNSERIYPFKNRPKFSWHGGDAPSAVKLKKELFEEL